jgi:Flp pilus assembly protein TadD
MQRNSAILTVVGVAVLGMASLPLFAQSGQSSSRKTQRTHQAAKQPAPSVSSQAEAAIEKNDYAAAEPLLLKAVTDDAKDWQAWYYLGYLYSATDRSPKAIDAYRHAVTENPKLFEANLNLGLLLATAGDRTAAAQYLKAATALKPQSDPNDGLFRAWYALGRLLSADDPSQATAALQRATELHPKDAAPHIELGQLLEKRQDLAAAEKEYEAAAALEPKNPEATTGLASVYIRSKRLPEAEAAIRRLLALTPNDSAAHLQLGRLLLTQNKQPEAIKEFQTALAADPNNLSALRELADLQLKAKQNADAEASFRKLVAADPRDPELHYGLGMALIQQVKYSEAKPEFLAAVKLKGNFAEAYANLALSAENDKDYGLALQALDARARFLPDTPSTVWIRATVLDHLGRMKEATEQYKKFLTMAEGKFPDQEWQARHRLIAIDPETRAKRK